MTVTDVESYEIEGNGTRGGCTVKSTNVITYVNSGVQISKWRVTSKLLSDEHVTCHQGTLI